MRILISTPVSPKKILVVDGGGSGFRKAIVIGNEIQNIEETAPLTSLEQLMVFIKENLPDDLDGISFSIAGYVRNDGKILRAPNIPFLNDINLGIKTYLETGSRFNVSVRNDMEAAATGVTQLFPELPYFLIITWSSGIGLRIVKNQEILAPSEGGHMKFDFSETAPLCGCGKKGCIEALIGGKGVECLIQETIEREKKEIPPNISPFIFLDQSFDRKEEWALEIYSFLAEKTGKFLANLQNLLCLPAIVWRGTFAKAVLPRIEAEIKKVMTRYIFHEELITNLKFYKVWEREKVKNEDIFLGAAKILERLILN